MTAGFLTAMREVVILTCEHATNHVPRLYRPLFRGAADVLKSHRGYDVGALAMARAMAKRAGASLFSTEVTRLLVEANRSLHHPDVFSEFCRGLPADAKKRILESYYHPHRDRVEFAVAAHVDEGRRVIHIGVHSFTPELDGVVRTADVGLLYDPTRPSERTYCTAWRRAIKHLEPAWRVRRNYPYRGAADGFTTYLRTCFPENAFLGLELEVNNELLRDGANQRRVARILADAMRALK